MYTEQYGYNEPDLYIKIRIYFPKKSIVRDVVLIFFCVGT